MQTTQTNGMRNIQISADFVQVRPPFGMGTQGTRFLNQKVPLYKHGVLTPPPYPAGGLVSNIAAVRGVLPCQAAPGARIQVLRRPPVPSTNGMQVPVGNFRGQRVGIMTQFPILSSLPIPRTNYN